MKNILILLGLLFAVCSCDDYFHDSGLADGKHDCTMWEYLNTQPQDWDSTVLLIERAGLVDLFDGKESRTPGDHVFWRDGFIHRAIFIENGR